MNPQELSVIMAFTDHQEFLTSTGSVFTISKQRFSPPTSQRMLPDRAVLPAEKVRFKESI